MKIFWSAALCEAASRAITEEVFALELVWKKLLIRNSILYFTI